MPSTPAAPLLLSTRFSAVCIFSRSNIASHTPTSDFPSSRAGDTSTLRSPPAGFTCFGKTSVPLSEGFCLPCSSRELLVVLILLLVQPFPKKTPVLWPLLTPAISACSLDQGCLFGSMTGLPRRSLSLSKGKNVDF